VPFSLIETSPLVPGVSPVKIYFREEGSGPPLFLLHGGWGHDLYPFRHQVSTLAGNFKIIIPDRSGYGRSTRLVESLPPDFHYRAATETLSVLDSLGIERACFWGHSDGAVIAAIIGFIAPLRVHGLVFEAFHYCRVKPASREFFETLAYRPEDLSADLRERFAREHGADYWQDLITSHAKAWLQLADESAGPHDDLYGGRLHEITAPSLFIHGGADPRTEPGELDAARAQLPNAEMQILDGGSHSPHSESATAGLVTELAANFLSRLR
jgi:pimeloyl-ACP methyl ester carboxylesterase